MKTYIALILTSLIIQISALTLVDQYVFKESYDFSSKKIETTTTAADDINIVIPSNTKNVFLSYEGKYISYFKDNTLYIGNTQDGNINEISTNKNESLIYYTWLENRDVLIILKKVNENGKEKIQLVSYNAKKSTQQVVSDVCDCKKGTEFKEITMSVLTGVYYINMRDNKNKDTVYRLDRNNDLSIVDIDGINPSKIETLRHIDRLVYQKGNDILLTSPDKKLAFDYTGEKSLLGIDENDTLYVGKIVNNKIASILYGKLNEDSSIKWNSVDISTPVDTTDISFNDKSEIVIVNKNEHFVYNLMTKEKTDYTGNLVQVKNKFVASVDEKGNLTYTYFNNQSN